MQTLGERLRVAMSSAGVNQADLARAVGVKPPSVNGWLSGKARFLRGENLLKAAAKLGVSAKWLAEGLGPMASDSADTAQASPPQAFDWRAIAYEEAKLTPESGAREFLLTFLGLVDERVQARQRLNELGATATVHASHRRR